MANHIKVEHELCAEDRARLDRIIELLDRPVMFGGVDFAPGGLKPNAPSATPTTKPNPGPKETPEQTVTMEDVKALVQKLIAPTTAKQKRDAARALVKSYANKVSEIPADKLAEVYNGLSEIDKGE